MESPRALLRSCAIVLSVGLVLARPSSGQGPVHKLNPPLARENTREVDDVRISPDGAWAVYRADPEQEHELFRVALKGEPVPVRLNAPIQRHGRFEITPDGRFVVYQSFDKIHRVALLGGRRVELADGIDFRLAPDGLSVLCSSNRSLLVVPVDGGAPPLTLVPWTQNTFLSEYRFSPDGSRVVYLASDGTFELFSVATDGSSAPVRLTPLPAGRSVNDYEISPDGTRVVYDADQVRDETFELFVIPIDGSAPAVRLHPAFQAGRRVRAFTTLPGSARVVYSADQLQREVVELFSVPIDGVQPPVRLSRALPSGGDIYFFSSTPDGRRIVYFGEQDVNDASEFYLVASDGSTAPRRLNDPLAAGERVSTGQLTPTGTHLVYSVSGPASTELFSVPILRDVEATLLSGPPSLSSFFTSPDGARVLFHVGGLSGLFSVPIDRSEEPVQLNGPLPALARVYPSVLVSPDSRTVLFRAEKNTLGVFDLLRAPIDGSAAAVQLNPTFESEIIADVIDVLVLPGGERALFRVDTWDGSDGSSSELYSVGLDTRALERLFPSGAIGAGDRDDVRDVRFTHDGARAVFRAGSEEGEDLDLFSVPVGGGQPPVRLNDRLGSGYGPERFELPEAGDLAVYLQEDDDDTGQLFAVPVDGSSGPRQLTNTGADRFRLAPDGARVAFVARLAPNQSALFGVPTDASSAPLQLAPTLTSPRGEPYELRIDRDSRLLVYGTDQDAGDVNELYAVPLDGSAPPTKLSGALVAGGDVMAGVLLVDGRALYRADQELDERLELYSVPLDGSSAPVKLSGALVTGGDVREAFEVTPDGRRVVYLADQEADERVELYSAPVDGSAAPVKLNATLVPGGDVVSTPGIPFRISPDGGRVVYRADQVRDEVFELYSVPIDRSGPPLQISGFLPVGGDVLGEFEVTSDGREVLYVADQRLDDVFELFRTPIDRIKESRRASAPLVEGGDALGPGGIPRIEIAPDSRVLYLADQDVDGAVEVYLTSSGRRHSHLLRR